MSVIDEVLRAADIYAKGFSHGNLQMPPARKLAVLACMDARLSVEPLLGLKTGDAHVIRNAGGVFTDDALRSMVISHYLLGTQEFMFIHHTDCGMLTFKNQDLTTKIRQRTGSTFGSSYDFRAFTDVEADLRQQMDVARAHPWIPKEVLIRGFVYDVRTGRLSEVQQTRAAAGSKAQPG